MNKKIRVAVGLSGGVDSSVSAALLKEQGFDVIGVFMKNWDDEAVRTPIMDGCTSAEDQEDARKVAKILNVPFHIMHFEKEYWDKVFANFISEYRRGRTPNPDVLCNKFIKFGYFLKKSVKELKVDFIATGHYVRKVCAKGASASGGKSEKFAPKAHPPRAEKVKSYELLAAVDKNKDQSYFLYALNQKQLSRALFPIGELTKPEVRELAKKFRLPTADKKDSQGICFVGEVQLKKFLKQWIKPHKGGIITVDGKKIGEHDGAEYFTIGQRHGLNVGGGIPYYVVSKNIKKNIVYVAAGTTHSALFKEELRVKNINWISGKVPKFPLRVMARIRYRQPLQSCRIAKSEIRNPKSEILKVIFNKPQRSVTSGQSAVFYDKETMLGGGIII